ncbi:LysR family transcriptional regulator ['Osedax' symbiont bacterium Rs2_46_30_T18]|nr:LysR family transcriptional regulator ['Osedax' symbiont bacterium Rs2_46_30_T18]
MSLPSLNSLRTFESAARLKSFSLASAELFVSPSAVSHQIRQLESRLGVALFVRLDRQVVLSAAGQRYYPQVKLGIDTLLKASRELTEGAADAMQEIKMSVVPFFATRWLLPKLSGFRKLQPNLQLKVQTSTSASDFNKQEFDLVIRRGIGPWKGMVAKRLCRERLVAVCQPKMYLDIQQVSDILDQPLLFNAKVMSEWREWFVSQQLDFNDPVVSFDFQNTSQILDACIAGTGVALIDPILITEELAQGKLRQIFVESVPSLRDYFIVYPQQFEQQQNVQLFEQWIFKQLALDPLMSDRCG